MTDETQSNNLAKRAGMRVVKNLSLFLIEVVIIAGVVLIMIKSLFNINLALMVGIGLQLIYATTILFSKSLRSVLTVWWAILALLSVAWWTFLLINNL